MLFLSAAYFPVLPSAFNEPYSALYRSRLIGLIVLLLSATLSAQTADKDSLRTALEQIGGHEVQLAYLDSVCAEYKASYQPGGAPYFQLRREILDPEGDLTRGAAHMNEAAFYYLHTNNLELMRQELAPYLERLDEIDAPDLQADIHYAASSLYENLGNNKRGLGQIDSCISILEVLQDSSRIQFGESYRAKARILTSMGRYPESVVAMGTAKDIFVATKDTIGIKLILLQLGTLHAQLGLFDLSEGYYNERLQLGGNSTFDLVQTKINLGRNLMTQKRFSEAEREYLDGLGHCPLEPQQAWVELFIRNGLIEALYFQEKHDGIPAHYKAMLDISESLPEGGTPGFIMDQSLFFKELAVGNYHMAEDLALSLYQGSLAKEDISEAILHTQFLSELYDKMGDHEQALEYYKLYSAANDSILTANKQHAALLFQTQYETREKEAAIDRLAAEKSAEEAKGRAYLWIAICLGALLGIGGYLMLQLRKARARLEKQNLELQALDRTKTKFFGIIGHDLAGPLVVLDSIAKRIKRQVVQKDLDKVEESVSLLSSTSTRLSDLLDNLLKWALSENGVMPYAPEPLSLLALIEESAEMYRDPAQQKGVSLNVDLPQDLKVYADRNAMSGVLRNLISNALKFTREGGFITVTAARAQGSAIITVSDTGSGMSLEQIRQILGSEMQSSQGTAGERGTGLGLKLVQELVKLNQGSLEIESAPGQGSQFNVHIPLA